MKVKFPTLAVKSEQKLNYENFDKNIFEIFLKINVVQNSTR